MKLFLVLFVALSLDGVVCAGILKRDVADKTKDDEDVYGILDENDGEIQKDQYDYYVDTKDDQKAEEAPADTGGTNEIDVESKPETFAEELGSVVRLPCQVSSKDEPVRVWYKESTLIYQGNIKIGNKTNYRPLSNGSLEVVLESPDDFGSYSCRIALSETVQPAITHKVIQKTSPKIVALYANDNKKVFDIGDTLTLTCKATGYPKPKISWHKNGDRLGTEGETLTIQNVKAKHSGEYVCFADNKVGQPAHNHTGISINHSPIVSIEKYIVNTDHKSDAELVCEVKAYPNAVVNWQRNGENVVSREPKIKLQREKNSEKNVLIIKNIEESDFGQYSCVAMNALGKSVKHVNLIKTPVVRKFEKNLSNESIKDVILQWKVESRQPISEHELQYRKKGETSWKTITPEVTNADNDVYLIKHTLKNLEPGVYETRARSKNQHGWSDYSDIIPFEGVLAKHGSHHQKAKHNRKEQKDNRTTQDPLPDTPAQHRTEEVMPVGESTSSSTILSSSIALIILGLLTIHVRH